jgi:hypothetical protein
MPVEHVAMTPASRFDVTWHDAGREPVAQPDPAYPNGMDIDCSAGAANRCNLKLPYPARRCGQYLVVCKTCGLSAIASTAGRPDDPCSLTVACKIPTSKGVPFS